MCPPLTQGLPELPSNFGDLMLANEKQTHVRVKATSFPQQTVREPYARGQGEGGGKGGWLLAPGFLRLGVGRWAFCMHDSSGLVWEERHPCAGAGEMGKHVDTLGL